MTVDKSDLVAKLREIEEIVEETKSSARTAGMAVAIGGVVLLLLVYVLGRRRGRKGSARVEVFRLG